ncbi:MAG TPA: export ABC transporter ATP-binding protein, partial [Planctomycetes bacterium]|nr:export ABC transporter ATP-binding protein [Planctomycetota bacterium]
PNGAGKSTLVACVVGLLRPDQGEVRFDSRPLDRRALARIGVAPQELALYPDLSG